MITRREQSEARRRAAALLRRSGFAVCREEIGAIEVADFGLGHLETEGAQILTLAQTDRFAVKLIALFAGQTLPEYFHPAVGDDPGKQEVIRVLYGALLVGTPGSTPSSELCRLPDGKDACYTCRTVQALSPGGQLLLAPGTRHWFQGGRRGAVVASFSSVARDALDRFTDPAVSRITVIGE